EPQGLDLNLFDTIDKQLKLVELVLRVNMIQALEQHQQKRRCLIFVRHINTLWILDDVIKLLDLLLHLDERTHISCASLADSASQQRKSHIFRQFRIDDGVALL
ncbi:MAG: hypothetical protein EB117_16955, partial [Betaproteobacteria bacterium]|nr:hypothetical protein [Betaproteobacteria bacterium]